MSKRMVIGLLSPGSPPPGFGQSSPGSRSPATASGTCGGDPGLAAGRPVAVLARAHRHRAGAPTGVGAASGPVGPGRPPRRSRLRPAPTGAAAVAPAPGQPAGDRGGLPATTAEAGQRDGCLAPRRGGARCVVGRRHRGVRAPRAVVAPADPKAPALPARLVAGGLPVGVGRRSGRDDVSGDLAVMGGTDGHPPGVGAVVGRDRLRARVHCSARHDDARGAEARGPDGRDRPASPPPCWAFTEAP